MWQGPNRDGVWALVPAKALARAKMRLSPVLSSAERSALQRAMLLDVLTTLSHVHCLAGVAVISPDTEVGAIANRQGATLIAEEPAADDLNGAIATGAEKLRKAGATIIVVIPADVPRLNPADVDRAVMRGVEASATVVVPDRHRQGTNALVFMADAPPNFEYGRDSFQRHLMAPANRPTIPLRLASLALDIDTPADLADLAAALTMGGAHETSAVMAAIGRHRVTPVLEEGYR